MTLADSDSKPERLYHETYLQLIKNSVGTEMFRNFYVKTPEKGAFDAMDDGSNSCAFFVSGVLVLFSKIRGLHGLVASTQHDLEESGWQRADIDDPQAGDVLVWEALPFKDGTYEHIGFYIGNEQAVSTSWTKHKVVEHDIHFGEQNRKITHVYRMADW